MALIILISGCSTTDIRELTGQITLGANLYTDRFGCAHYLYKEGTVQDGAQRIIGVVRVSSVKSRRALPNGQECIYNLMSTPVDLSQDILIIEFSEADYLRGEWILSKPDFADGEISLSFQ